jgi:hypothetical protein
MLQKCHVTVRTFFAFVGEYHPSQGAINGTRYINRRSIMGGIFS